MWDKNTPEFQIMQFNRNFKLKGLQISKHIFSTKTRSEIKCKYKKVSWWLDTNPLERDDSSSVNLPYRKEICSCYTFSIKKMQTVDICRETFRNELKLKTHMTDDKYSKCFNFLSLNSLFDLQKKYIQILTRNHRALVEKLKKHTSRFAGISKMSHYFSLSYNRKGKIDEEIFIMWQTDGKEWRKCLRLFRRLLHNFTTFWANWKTRRNFLFFLSFFITGSWWWHFFFCGENEKFC